jgi:hypothetical protein
VQSNGASCKRITERGDSGLGYATDSEKILREAVVLPASWREVRTEKARACLCRPFLYGL